MSSTGGKIQYLEAFAQGKMMESSGWADCLPRGCTPSDVDLYFDNHGRIIYCEFSSKTCDWNEVADGQRIGYANHIRGGKHVAVLCYHEVPVGQIIRTCEDVSAFSVLFYDRGRLVQRAFRGNGAWQSLVRNWYAKGADFILKKLRDYDRE